MTKMILPMAEVPGVIRESLRTVLSAHGYELVHLAGTFALAHGPMTVANPLSPDQREALLNEVGRNSAQALFSIDESLNAADADDDRPETADLLTVGQTLRSLAATGRPNPETALVLGRVGEWLAGLAKAELAKKAA